MGIATWWAVVDILINFSDRQQQHQDRPHQPQRDRRLYPHQPQWPDSPTESERGDGFQSLDNEDTDDYPLASDYMR